MLTDLEGGYATRYSTSLVVLSALALATCSTGPTTPTTATTRAPATSGGDEGTSSTSAVTVERIRLQRVDGPDLMTTLVTGQIIDVPLNKDLRIWAEIRRLETDFVRLVVDWGDGNKDFFPCGACRVDNKYKQKGLYTVTAKLVDQNAPSGTAPILSVTVTLSAYDFDPAPTPTPVPSNCSSIPAATGALGLVPAGTNGAQAGSPAAAMPATIGFDGLSGLPGNFSVFIGDYSESGFTVSATLGCWWVMNMYGRPAPMIVSRKVVPATAQVAVQVEVMVTAGGLPFTFWSVDLYSSVTQVPYTFLGSLNGSPVFTVSDLSPNAYGNILTVSNPSATATIDTLRIVLTNPATPSCPTCVGNPVGLDNIVLSR